MNRFEIMGRLTEDPKIEYRDTQDPLVIARFGVAVDRKFRKGDVTADFFHLTAFGKLAEFAEKYLQRGTKILATCRIENNNYTRRDGVKVYGYAFITEEIEFCESKAAADQRRETQGAEGNDGFMNIPEGEEEEMPFR